MLPFKAKKVFIELVPDRCGVGQDSRQTFHAVHFGVLGRRRTELGQLVDEDVGRVPVNVEGTVKAFFNIGKAGVDVTK